MILHILVDIVSRSSSNLPYEKIDGETHCLSDFAPFDIPNSWEWCRVGDLFTNMSGLAYKKDSLNVKSKDMVRVLRGGNIGDEVFYFKEDDVMISSEFVKSELYLKKNYMITPAVSSLEHIGKIALIDNDYSDVVVGGFVLMLIPYFSNDELSQYLLYAFDAKNHRDNCRNITHKSGQAFYNLSRERLMNLPIPLPPTAEIKRINEQLKRTLPYVSEYATIDDKINTLNSSFPEILKKSILQQAVMGKLVPQDDNDEPASVLLDRIRVEKQALIKAGRLKKDKHESIIYRRDNSHYEKVDDNETCINEEVPFDIPHSWEWCRLVDIVSFIGGYAYKSTDFIEKSDYQVLRLGNIKNDLLKLEQKPVYISEQLAQSTQNFTCKDYDILLTMTGTRGKRDYFYTVMVRGETNLYINQRVGCLRPYYPEMAEWLILALKSECILSQVFEYETGTANQGNLGAENILKTLIPIPPRDEQKRISKVISRSFEGIAAL